MQKLNMHASVFTISLLLYLAMTVTLIGCGSSNQEIQDGYYMAQAQDFDENGWKEYVSIYVKDSMIVTVDYNAKNLSGFIKSWDMEYMRGMRTETGTYPNEYRRLYAESLINRQDPDQVDVVSGATYSYTIFQQLAAAAIEQAENGDEYAAEIDIDVRVVRGD